MNYTAVATSLAIGLCMVMGCKKEDPGPDVALYTSKLAGDRTWAHQRSIRHIGVDTSWSLNDTSFAIEALDDMRLKVYGYELTYYTYTDSALIYKNQPDQSLMFVYYGALHYDYKKDSICFSSMMLNKGNGTIDSFTTRL